MIQDLLQELKYRMPNDFYKYTDKLEEGDLIKYRDRLKVKVLRSKNIGKTNQPTKPIPIRPIGYQSANIKEQEKIINVKFANSKQAKQEAHGCEATRRH